MSDRGPVTMTRPPFTGRNRLSLLLFWLFLPITVAAWQLNETGVIGEGWAMAIVLAAFAATPFTVPLIAAAPLTAAAAAWMLNLFGVLGTGWMLGIMAAAWATTPLIYLRLRRHA